ncbi:hypothetical protein IPF89_02395 [Candidatus Saccharibacteria bacterium]|nr:MAG: hypothetical protein IPF89_02395 [Candidatus Saccharibacteria bacterium]
MKDWHKDAPELYETLLGNAEDIGEGWQYSRTEVLKYYAKLQKYWMLNSHVEFELDDKLTAAFAEIDELIAAHKKPPVRLLMTGTSGLMLLLKTFVKVSSLSTKSQNRSQIILMMHLPTLMMMQNLPNPKATRYLKIK